MAEPSLSDPFALWRDLRSQFEKRVNELANQGMQSDEFAAGMHKALGASLATRQVTKEMMQRYLESLNVPTRADVHALGERLQSIEDRLLGMSAALDRLAGGQSVGLSGSLPASPPRTKKPPVEPLAQAPVQESAPIAPAGKGKRSPASAPAARRKQAAAPKSRKARMSARAAPGANSRSAGPRAARRVQQ